MRVTPGRGWLAAGLLALAAALPPASARAQRALVLSEAGVPVVSLAIDLNAGGIWDPALQAGVSRLAAEALLEGMRPRLGALGASARLECDRFGLRFTLLAPTATWRTATELVLDGIFQPEVTQLALDSARARLLRSLRFQEGDPAAEIRTAAHQALFGEEHRWARGPCGTPETLDSVPLEDVQAAAAARFHPARAAAALVGPVTAEEGGRVLGRVFRDARLPTLLPLPDPPPLPGSRDVDTPAITSWVGVVFPLPREPDDEATRLLAQAVLEDVRPAPGRPHVVDAWAEVERFGGGGALIVYVVAEGEEARAWIERVRARVEAAATVPLRADAFALLLRRYRGSRLLELGTPEARAEDAADRLFFEHAYQLPVRRIDALTPERLRDAAAALGPPAAAYLGPVAAGATSSLVGKSGLP